jgi:hypothetical protein
MKRFSTLLRKSTKTSAPAEPPVVPVATITVPVASTKSVEAPEAPAPITTKQPEIVPPVAVDAEVASPVSEAPATAAPAATPSSTSISTVDSTPTITTSPTLTSVGSVTLGDLPTDPADLLVDRCKGWKSLLSALSHHFENIADAEKDLGKKYEKVAKSWLETSKDGSAIRDTAFEETSSVQVSPCTKRNLV